MNMKKWLGWLTAVSIGLSVGTADATVIAYWKFEGTGSTFLSDSSGNGHHLTNNTSVPGSNHVSSTASSLNGSTQSAFFSSSGGHNLYTTLSLNLSSYSAITVEAYMKANFLGGAGVLFEHTVNYNSFVGAVASFISGTSTLEGGWRMASGYNVDSGSLSSPADWHHVAVIYDKTGSGNKILMYVDGVLFGSDTMTSTSAGTFVNSNWYIGGRGPGAGVSFAGFIDEMRISSGVLTPDQFLMNAVVPEPSTVLLLLTGVGILWYARKKRQSIHLG